MSKTIKAIHERLGTISVHLDRVPAFCPVCKRHCSPTIMQGFIPEGTFRDLQVTLLCPAEECKTIFVARYKVNYSTPTDQLCQLKNAAVMTFVTTREFSDHITGLSSDFCGIYADAEKAEVNGLTLICGVGYRKSLEFLVKDFLIKHRLQDSPTDQETVRKSPLMFCIQKYIENPRLRAAVERATWLGNDETHYIRAWHDKDLSDLKALINITVSWIDMEMETDRYEREMPAKGSKS